MPVTTILFFCFSSVLLFAALRVITARSSVNAVLYLVLAFFSASCVWLLLQAEFLAITLVLVYVGAVMVLFLFVVMMLDINLDKVRRGFWRHFPMAAFIGVFISVEMAFILLRGFNLRDARPMDVDVEKIGNTKMLGIELYTEYLYPVEIAAVLLLVAIIAAIALTFRRRKDSKYISVNDQIRARRADRVRLVKMDAEIEKSSDTSSAEKGKAQ